jgi:hypothetical protein
MKLKKNGYCMLELENGWSACCQQAKDMKTAADADVGLDCEIYDDESNKFCVLFFSVPCSFSQTEIWVDENSVKSLIMNKLKATLNDGISEYSNAVKYMVSLKQKNEKLSELIGESGGDVE